jgi:hypothetical protein
VQNRTNCVAYPRLLRWCGLGGILGGVLFVAWGYIDRPNISENLRVATHMLAFAVPVLFLVAVAGLWAVLRGSRFGVFRWTGMALTIYGSGWGVVRVIGGESVWVYFAERGWPPYMSSWLPFVLTGLTLIGIATVRGRPLRGMGALVLTIGVFGWVYCLTNAGGVLEARSVHIGFGLLFSLGWVALGLTLWLAATKQAKESRM